MIEAKIKLDRDFRVGDIDDRMYGSFVEHLGRQVYGGIYEPDHPTADDMGFRQDVMGFVRELNLPIIRYPGGNFVSAYNWEDGVGPVEKRPVVPDVVWRTMEPNTIGTNEFCEFARRVGAETMMAVNMGTRGVEAARNLVEYCNHPSGSYWSDLRISHGIKEPHGIKVWCLGNEMDGMWQMGHKPADEYGRLVRETSKVMKRVDDTIETTVSGSSHGGAPTFPQWEAGILDECYDFVDYLSLHTYLQKPKDNTGEFLAMPYRIDNFLTYAAGVCDYIQAKKRSKKQMKICFDEWNVWYHCAESSLFTSPWQFGQPYIEEIYTFEDALVVGSVLITLLKHADRVKIACYSELVNEIACIMTKAGGPAWRQTTYYPLLHASQYRRGVALNTIVDSPTYETNEFGPVPYLDSIAVLNEEHETLTIFAVNRSQEDDLTLTCDLRGVGDYRMVEQLVLDHNDRFAINSENQPDNVVPRQINTVSVEDDKLTATLPKLSWNVIRLERAIVSKA